MEQIKEFFKNDHFAALIGCKALEASEGYAKVELTVGKQHLNAGGSCQGGVLFTLADYAMAIASNSHGKLTVSIQSNISFIKAANLGDVLTAEAREVINHHKLPYIEIKITNQKGDTICAVTGQCYRKDVTLPFYKGE